MDSSKDALTPLLRLPPGEVAEQVLVCGDPARARQIASRLENARLVASNREYETHTGEYRGVRISAVSHGIGAPGAAICFEELIRAGARTIIRCGTCGSYAPAIRSGQLLIGQAATREDGYTNQLVPPAYPAVADITVTQALMRAAAAHSGVRFAVGVLRSQAVFYDGLYPADHDLWIKAGALGIEMELAALLIVAALRGARAGGIFTVDGNPAESADLLDYNPYRDAVDEGKAAMITIALEALVALSR